MTNEDKQLLLEDLCGRLLSGVIVEVSFYPNSSIKQAITFDTLEGLDEGFYEVTPYLRSLSSMTEEEKKEYDEMSGQVKTFYGREAESYECAKLTDWLNAHHFDYRGLIPMGLALEAPKDMYKTE